MPSKYVHVQCIMNNVIWNDAHIQLKLRKANNWIKIESLMETFPNWECGANDD